MATTKYVLDSRHHAGDSSLEASVKLFIYHRRKYAAIPTGIRLKPEQWDEAAGCICAHPQKNFLNRALLRRQCAVENVIVRLSVTENILSMSAAELAQRVQMELDPNMREAKKDPATGVAGVFRKFIGYKRGHTKELYECTLRRLEAYLGKNEASMLRFEQIDRDFLEGFDAFMSQSAPSANARSIHLRNLRAVCNYAIDINVTEYYGFRRYKIKSEPTRKRNLGVDTLRRIFAYRCEEEWQQRYLDAFKLCFMLVGINVVDLCLLRGVQDGRISYVRRKTKTEYSVKVEPEAMEILRLYPGKNYLLDYMNGCKNYRYFYNRLSLALNELKAKFDLAEFTSYQARHSWATIARRLGVSKDTIALALGHGKRSVTDIYIEEDLTEVDEANRKVLDYVLHSS